MKKYCVIKITIMSSDCLLQHKLSIKAYITLLIKSHLTVNIFKINFLLNFEWAIKLDIDSFRDTMF